MNGQQRRTLPLIVFTEVPISTLVIQLATASATIRLSAAATTFGTRATLYVTLTEPLPTDYQQVSYLESTGTQYINTGYKANYNTSVRTKVMFNETSASQGIYCSRDGSVSSNTYSLFIVNTAFRHDYKSSQTTTSLKTSANTDYEISSNKNVLTINNQVYNTATYTSFSASYNMTLMASTVGGTGLANYLNGRMYYCKIYDNDLLVRDLVPCYRKSDNKPGFYDILNNVFYTNAGTGEFTVGPNV